MNISKNSEIDYIVHKIICSICGFCNVYDVFMVFVDEINRTYTVKEGAGIFSECTMEGPIESGIVGQVYQTQKMVIVENYGKREDDLSDPAFEKIAYLAVLPLLHKDKVIAIVGIASPAPNYQLSDDKLYLLQQYIDLASITLKNTLDTYSLREVLTAREEKIKVLAQHCGNLSTVFQLQQSAVGLMQLDGTYVSVNTCFCQTIGYTAKEVLGKTGIKIGLWLHDQDIVLEKIKKQQEINNLEVWLLGKNGKMICGSLAARIIFLNNELFILFSLRDIATQKDILEKLNVLEDKYARLFHMSQEGILVIGFDGTILEVNFELTRMCGFSKEEIIGKTCKDWAFLLNFEERERLLKKRFYDNVVQRVAFPFRQKNGNVIYIQGTVCKFSLSGTSYFMAVVRNITMQIRAEQEVNKQAKMLLLNKDKLSAAAGLADFGDWEYDPSTEMFEFSDEFYALYNTDAAREGRVMSFDAYLKEFVCPEDLVRISHVKNSLVSAKQDNLHDEDIMYRIIRRDGTMRTMLVRRNFIKDDDGKIIKAYGINQDITEWLRVEDERCRQAEIIKHMAYFDFLTNLPNRQNLNEWLSKEMEQAQSGKAEGVVLFVDLDELKMVNDTYGHTYGDKIIVASGCRITEVLGKDTFVARIGGDEFVAVLQGTYQHEQIVIIMEKISKVLSQKQEYLGMSFHITASIGIACYPSDGNTVDEIIKNADNAMFAAKRNGKNCWQFYNQGMQSEAYKKIRLIEKLRCALDRGEFSLLYQPQISIPQRAVIGFEALLRWKNSEYGSVPPLRFIPLAEQSGLIHRIGEWVLREACFFARRLVDQGWANIRVAINVSAKQVSTDDFVAIVCNAVNAAGIEPQQLDIEITESVFMTSMDDAIRKLEQLKKFGVHLSLDDFGTGFSSLTYLRLLPFDTLKIDKTFIDLIETDYQGANIIDTIISMAQMNNMSVVAEGVETEKQLEYLINKKCDCIQGYLFSKPSVEATVVEMLSKEMQPFVQNR